RSWFDTSPRTEIDLGWNGERRFFEVPHNVALGGVGQFAGAVEVADGGDQVADGLLFDVGEVRIPAVDDQHHAGLVAVVPGLVLEGVVEGHAPARLPDVRFAAHAQRAIGRHDQRQVGDQ